MTYKTGKFKCGKCDNPVYRRDTKLCMKCRAIEKTGIRRVPIEIQIENNKKYKKQYFLDNKDKIYQKRKLNPITKQRRPRYYIKSKYGISYEEYEQMLIDRNFCCDICGYKQPTNATKMQKLYIDHNHTTNTVRGLICFRCNTALGYLKDNIEIIEKTIKYLKQWQDN